MFWAHVLHTFLYIIFTIFTIGVGIGIVKQAEVIKDSEGWRAFSESILFLILLLMFTFLAWAGGFSMFAMGGCYG